MIRNVVWTALVRTAIALLTGLMLAAVATAPTQAAVPGDSGGFDHFVDCAWLIVTNGVQHHLHCGPSQVDLAPGFPGTGIMLQSPTVVPSQTELPPSAPSCCSCGGNGSIDLEFGPLLAAADETLWTGHGDSLQQFLLACCPCGG